MSDGFFRDLGILTPTNLGVGSRRAVQTAEVMTHETILLRSSA
jgi:hypothetical protein